MIVIQCVTVLLEYFDDCSIRVSRSPVIILMIVIQCVTVLLEYLDLFHTKHAKFPGFGAPFFQNFALTKILLANSAHPYTSICLDMQYGLGCFIPYVFIIIIIIDIVRTVQFNMAKVANVGLSSMTMLPPGIG